ncbi:MAG: hypothetical protein ACRCZJ_04170 [Erysipelotrichaceae bacterium]
MNITIYQQTCLQCNATTLLSKQQANSFAFHSCLRCDGECIVSKQQLTCSEQEVVQLLEQTPFVYGS